MKNLFALLVLIISITSCVRNKTPKVVHSNSNEIAEIQKDTTFVDISDLPIHIDSTAYMVHPIGNVALNQGWQKEMYKSSRYTGQSFSTSNYSGYRLSGNLSNVLFQHIESDTLIPLTDKVIRINAMTFLHEVYKETGKQVFMYEINDLDTNLDKKLDYNDINSLFISNIDGSSFKKLTENNREVINWQIVPVLNRLYYRTVEDTNKDGIFNNTDKMHYKYVNLSSPKLDIVEYFPLENIN